jgi:hypothetical protein
MRGQSSDQSMIDAAGSVDGSHVRAAGRARPHPLLAVAADGAPFFHAWRTVRAASQRGHQASSSSSRFDS